MSSRLCTSMCEKWDAPVGYFQGIRESSVSSNVTFNVAVLYAYDTVTLGQLQDKSIYSFCN